jgi:environmental stress-induced protein Ves
MLLNKFSRRAVISAVAACASTMSRAHIVPGVSAHEFIDARLRPSLLWKNGAGARRELAASPVNSDSDGFEWRIGIAEVAGDAPFSVFPSVDRCITLLHGAGMRMKSPDGRIDHALDQPLRPYCFPGEAVIESWLIGGASEAFNVMVRRGMFDATTSVVRSPLAIGSKMCTTMIYCVSERARVVLDREVVDLTDGQAALWREQTPALTVKPATARTALVLVQLRRVKGIGA